MRSTRPDPPKAVLDTNIVVRGQISAHGKPAAVLDAFYARRFVWVTSPTILREIEAVLRRPELRLKTRMTEDEITLFIRLLWLETDVVPGLYDLSGVTADPKDDMFVACAVEGQAEYLVTADRSHLLALHPYRLLDHTVQILTADEFLDELSRRERTNTSDG